ncbi:hypothetical protein AGMMS4957_20620 [Bacteroidia bacterium]|nr:hypothetical protein AGMMS4957_20620 [Bacteroidia bacterium]
MNNKLFVLSGASGSGKTSLLKKIVIEKGLCKQAPKYSNRAERKNELFDDITHVDKLDEKKCDIRYERYTIEYGINSNEIKAKLSNKSQIVIISDIKAISEINNKFGKDASIVFVYLQNLCIDNLLKERHKLKLSDKKIKVLANHILDCRKAKNIKWLDSIAENIQQKIKDSFPNNIKYQEFIKRCESWISIEIDYEDNKDLFDDTIRGETIDELYDKFYEIFQKHTK